MDSIENTFLCASLGSRWPQTIKPFLKGNARSLFVNFNMEKSYSLLPYDDLGEDIPTDEQFMADFMGEPGEQYSDPEFQSNVTKRQNIEFNQSVTYYHSFYVLGYRRLHSFKDFLASLSIMISSPFIHGEYAFNDGVRLKQPNAVFMYLYQGKDNKIVPIKWSDDDFMQVILSDYFGAIEWMYGEKPYIWPTTKNPGHSKQPPPERTPKGYDPSVVYDKLYTGLTWFESLFDYRRVPLEFSSL